MPLAGLPRAAIAFVETLYPSQNPWFPHILDLASVSPEVDASRAAPVAPDAFQPQKPLAGRLQFCGRLL